MRIRRVGRENEQNGYVSSRVRGRLGKIGRGRERRGREESEEERNRGEKRGRLRRGSEGSDTPFEKREGESVHIESVLA